MKQYTYSLAFKIALTLCLLGNILISARVASQAAPSEQASLVASESVGAGNVHDSSLISDDLLASESSQSQAPGAIATSAQDESQLHKAFTSGQALRPVSVMNES